jgi:RIP homotypic interaction motif
LEKRTREFENQIAHLEGKLESKDSEMARLERLLATPKVQINNSGNLQIGSNNNMGDNRAINTSGGNYYESIDTSGGDYIQGNYINMSQDLTQAASQIQDLIEQLQTSGVAVDVAREQVTKDVAAQAQKNPTVRDKLIKWGQSLEDATISDVVKDVVKLRIRSAGIPLP